MNVSFARRAFLFAIGVHAMWSSALLAERAPLSESQLVEEADLIVTGEIADLRLTTGRSEIEQGFGNYDWAIYVTIKIDEVQSGDVSDSENIVARCFRIKTRKSLTEYLTPSGNHPIPSIGTRVRAHLYARDQSWGVIYPNGFQPVSDNDKLSDAEAVTQLNTGGFTFLLPIELWILGLVIGLPLILATLFVVRVGRRRRSEVVGSPRASTD